MMDFYMPVPVQLMLRHAGEKTMIIGVCNHKVDIPEDGIIIVGHALFTPCGVYDTSGIEPGFGAAQILTSGIRFCDCKRLDI